METILTNPYEILAEGFVYPAPGRIEYLQGTLAQLPEGSAKKAFVGFIQKIERLSLAEWEELHTRTLDLNPPAAPYVGFQTWGESYQRGEFLSKLAREMFAAEVDGEGELPDHLIPVLRYLAITDQPLPDLQEALLPALQRMEGTLRKAEPDNPYIDLLVAAIESCKGFKKEAA
jgi:nitrate reductase molybdenum cofactor assembly chaperone NarJ/NarW